MDTNASFIISIDSSYEMVNNFFENLLQDNFAMNSEIIVVLDAITNCSIIKYLKKLDKSYENIRIFFVDKKMGYGRANNYAVKQSSGDILYFINTDVFADKGCFEKMYYHLINGSASCVQPLLIWPQNNRIQCAGSTFGPYYKKHLLAGRLINTINMKDFPLDRQALTSALYAMKKEDFYSYGMFDEFYFNKLESFELSLKLTLAGKRCICIPDAIAYHSQGTGRNQYFYDFYQQEAYFWVKMGSVFKPDIHNYYQKQLTKEMLVEQYYAVLICQIRTAKNATTDLGLRVVDFHEINGVNPNKINLYELLPYSLHQLNIPLLFFVENIMDLASNKRWFATRLCKNKDIVIDTFGNLLYIEQI